MALKFTDYYAINAKTYDIEFLDIPVDHNEIQAFVCPFLIEGNKSDSVVLKLSRRITAFLTTLNSTYIKTNDFRNGIPFLNHLHEPNEYHLGYSVNNKGKAVSRSKSEDIFNFLRNNKFAKQGFSITNQAHNVLLLVDGIGQDIMSDILCNVGRDIFAEFTNKVCKKYLIPTQPTIIEFYDESTSQWQTKTVELPHYGKSIILVPTKILSGGRAYTNRYNWFIASNYMSKIVLNLQTPPAKTVQQLKDGTKKATIKEIYKRYKKPKKDLIDFVLEYPNSLDEFIEHAKLNYPELRLDHLK
ncbi:MAG: hypothetical protein EOP48_03430 [Sphingobacteriales bacterium]|nr:MAG: hypothetical protein EOP48_03430 [Sphingobacteriales bacterium]